MMKSKLIIALVAFAGGIILFTNQIFVADSAANSVAEPFKVTVVPSKTRLRIQEPFEINFEVKNITHTNLQFIIMSDDLYSSWRTDNPDIRLFRYQEVWHNNNNNHPLEIILAPGKSFRKSVKVWTLSSVQTNQASFRMGFTPFVDKERPYSNRLKRNSYWSNEVKIVLDEPAKEIAPFKIIVTPATNQVHIGDKFKVHLQVRNVTNTNQYFDTMTCSWDENWTTDSLFVGSESWGCDRNVPVHVELDPGRPGRTWANDMDLVVNQSVRTNKFTFRMGFTPICHHAPHDSNPEKWKFYWSDFVAMNLIPN